jgi:hypothetical protein
VLLAAVALAVLLSRRPPAAVDSTAGTPGTAGSAAVLPAEVPQTGLAPARASVEAASVEAANRPERERRIPIRRPVSPTSPADSHFADHEARRLEVLRVRDALGRGIASVRTDLEGQQFTAAREQLSQLQERTVPYRADLIDEVATLRALDQEITSTQISLKTNALAKQQEEAKWQQRLQQIQSLLDDKGYPEADKMASRLESEPGVPEEVAAKAHALRDAARQALKEIFGTTKIKTREEIVKRPPL